MKGWSISNVKYISIKMLVLLLFTRYYYYHGKNSQKCKEVQRKTRLSALKRGSSRGKRETNGSDSISYKNNSNDTQNFEFVYARHPRVYV